jgi:ubiquinone/menaquinone biosynthesis C-methylase UbiE
MDDTRKYILDLINKCDYYDSERDRMHALKSANIQGKKLLDVGTGKGKTAYLAKDEFLCEVTSVDISPEKIKRAQRLHKNIRFLSADAGQLPFDSGSFDAAICYNTLHHSKGRSKIIDEMFRVARDKVVITEITPAGAEIFDQFIHPEENHAQMALDHAELLKTLQARARVKIMERKLMTTYICIKRRDKNEIRDKH